MTWPSANFSLEGLSNKLSHGMVYILKIVEDMSPESVRNGAMKYLEVVAFNVSKISSNQSTILIALIFALTMFVSLLYCSFVRYVLRPTLRKYVGMEFENVKFSILKQSMSFSKIIIFPLKSPVILPIFGALFPSSVVKRFETSDDYPESTISIQKFGLKLRIGSLTGRIHRSDSGTKSFVSKIMHIIRCYTPRPVIVVKMSNVILTVEKAYIAPQPPVEFHATERLPSAIPPSHERDHKLPTFDQDAVLDFLRNDEVNDADAVTFWIERWISHVVAKMKKSEPVTGGKAYVRDSPTDDEKANSFIGYVVQVFLHSISFHLQNVSLVLTGADSDLVKATREMYSSREANFVLAKLPRSKRALSIICADAIEIAFSSDEDCNLFLCCARVHIKVGIPFPNKADQNIMAWHSIAHPFEVVAEFKGTIPILIWALNYDHHFHTKSVDLHVTVSELAISLSPRHLHTLLLHLDDWIDANAPYNEWLLFLRDNHTDTLGLSDREKLAYCESYQRVKTRKVKDSKEINGKKLLSVAEIKGLEKKMTRHEIMSLRCFAMRQLWRIPKESQEFDDYMRMSKSSIVESNNPTQDSPAEIIIPFQQQYPSPLHALVTLVRRKYALLSLFKIKYIARKLHIDLPSDTEEFGANKDISTKRVPTCLTSSGVSFELLKSDPLFKIPDSASLDCRRPVLIMAFNIKEMGWSVVRLHNHVDQLPTFLDNEPLGILYKQKVPMNSHVLNIELKMEVAPTSKEECTISLNLMPSDLVIIVNALPLLSALHTLLDASCIPLQRIGETELDHASVDAVRASLSPGTLGLSMNDSDQLDDSVDQSESGFLQTLTTDVAIKVEHISILFLVNGTALCHDILHFDVRDIEITLDLSGIAGDLTITTEPFEFRAGQIIETSSAHIDWELLPFKPIATVQGVKLLASIKENRVIKEAMYDIGIRSGLEFVEVNLSPLTLTALNGAIHSVQPFFAANMEDEDQLKARRQAEQDDYRSNLFRQRQELRRIFNTIDVNHSGTLQDYELEKLVRMMFEKSSQSSTTYSATCLTAAEMHREKMFLLSMFDSKGTNEVTFPDVDMILYRIANDIDDSNLTPDTGSTGISYLDNFSKSSDFLSGIFLRRLIRFEDLREYTAMHHVFRITGYDKIDKKSNFPAPTLWHAGGIEMFWDHYDETGCTRDSLNNQDIRMVQQKLVRSLCNYEFAKYCWRVLVQPEFHRSSPRNELEHEVTSWLLDNDPKCTANDSFIDLLLKHVKNASDDNDGMSSNIHVQYAVSLDIVVDSVTLSFGSAHTSNLIEVEFSHIRLKSRALLSSSRLLAPDTEDRNNASFSGIMSARYLNTKHGYMECAIQHYPCYGSATYKVNLPDASESTDSSSFSACLDCPRFLNIDVGPALLETSSVIAHIISFSYPQNSSVSLFSGCLQLHIKNSTGREIKVSTERLIGSVVNPEQFQTLTAIGIDSYSFFPLPSNKGAIGGFSFFTEKYKMIPNIEISPYQPRMFPLLRRKKQHGKTRDKQSVSGFGSFLTLVPKADSLDAITVEARSCVTIQAQISVKIRVVRLPKSLGYLNKRGAKSLIDLNKKNLIPALRRLVRGALIVYEKDIAEGFSCAVPIDLFNSSRYFALLIQDTTSSDRSDKWRDPVLLTRDFLFNTMGIADVSRSHSLSGIVVKKERLNVQVSSKCRDKHHPLMAKRTAWDCRIVVVPFFIVLNSMPFPLCVRIWQYNQADVDAMWIDPTLTNEEEDSSGDEDQSSSMGSSWVGNILDEVQYHLPPPEGSAKDIYSEVGVKRGRTILLSGINLQQRLFLQVSQNVESIGLSGAKLMWSSPLQIRLDRLRTGAIRKGTLSLPQRILDLGDDIDALVDTSIDGETGMPTCTIFCPYWIMNKTGMKMEYMVSGQSKNYIDSGAGGLPIMIHGAKFARTNKIYKKSSSEISALPLESPKEYILKQWWDESSNGTLVLKSNGIKNREGHPLVGWSEHIEMDAAGTSGKLNCKDFVLSAKIDSLAGAFYKTNLITLSPHFIVKNMLHITVTIIPLCGSQNDAIRSANKLLSNPELFSEARIDLPPDKSTILYTFHQISSIQANKWVAFFVKATRSSPTFKGRWHIISLEKPGSTYYGEHDGLHSTMCGILEVKTHSSDGGARVISISHAKHPPFCIENRSNTHYLQFSQDDDEASVFELPPMHSCGYTWDSPLGNRRLRATVIRQDICHWASFDDHRLYHTSATQDQTGSISTESADIEENSFRSPPKKKNTSTPRQAKSDASTKSIGATTLSSYKTPSIVLKRSKIFGASSRSYNMSKVGRKKDLPCPTNSSSSSSSHLHVHLRILAGTKILSFNDSDFLAQQVEGGIMRKGGYFKSALLETSIEGLQLTVLDDSPSELLGITVRDVQFIKPRGSIEATIRVRHFQVDAMLPDARYPIIIQPLPLGVDRRKNINRRDTALELDKSDNYWAKHDERPVPVLEMVGSYVPQTNMMWIPNLFVMISPCKVNVDVDYIFRIVGMIITSISKYKITSITTSYSATRQANSPLKFTTKGQTHFCLTYLEKLYIAPVYFEIELDIKDDRSSETEEGASTLHSIARMTNSAIASAILGWIINVGANFAHVSPTFKYSELTDADRYCDIIDLARDIVVSYVIQSIQQSYKVIFSMHLLGDPSLLAHEWKTGVTDLVSKTHDEVKTGGKEGVGKGFASFLQHVVGGTFFFVGKATSSMAKMIDSVTSNDLTSTHLKPDFASHRNGPRNASEGIVQGTDLLARTIIYGVAGLIGNPYRGAKTGRVTGLTKGFVSGLGGAFVSPFIGALGFIAKTTEGIGAQTKCLEIGVIQTRCRPARTVPWGSPMPENVVPYMKAVGIRVHTVRYQKVRKRIGSSVERNNDDSQPMSWKNSKEFKRIKTAEERRNSPPRKLVTILYPKGNHSYSTSAMKPKLLPDEHQNDILSRYAVIFLETVVLRVSDMQLCDEVVIQFRNNTLLKATSKPLSTCKITIGDIHSFILNFYREQMVQNEKLLTEKDIVISNDLFNSSSEDPRHITRPENRNSLVIPAPQEFSLFRTSSANTPNPDMLDSAHKELSSIQRSEEEREQEDDSDSYVSPDALFENEQISRTDEADHGVRTNERLYGTISLSFFPIPW